MMRFHNFPLRKRESFTPIASPTHSYNPRPYRFSMRLRRDDPASTNAASHRTHHKHKPAPSPRPPQRLGYSSVAGPVATSGRGLEPCIAGESISTSTSPLATSPPCRGRTSLRPRQVHPLRSKLPLASSGECRIALVPRLPAIDTDFAKSCSVKSVVSHAPTLCVASGLPGPCSVPSMR